MFRLSEMVDLAIGTPELGCVNYNVLHSLLHGILAKTHISDSPMKINVIAPRVDKHGSRGAGSATSPAGGGRSRDASVRSSDSDLELQFIEDPKGGAGRPTPEEGAESGGGGGSSGERRRTDSGGKARETPGKGVGAKKTKAVRRPGDHGPDDAVATVAHSVPFQELVLKVERLETAWEELNDIPRMESFKNIADDEQADGETGGRGGGPAVPLKDAWDYLQMHKQVDANKEGVDKLMVIVQDILKRMKKLTKSSDEQLKLINGSQQKLSDLSARQDDLETVKHELESVVGKVDSLHETRDKEELVTWNTLESALKGSGRSASGQRLTPTASSASLRKKESQRSVGGAGVEPKASTESLRDPKSYDGDDADSHESGEGVRTKDSRQRLAGKSSGVQVHKSGSGIGKKKGRSPDDGRGPSQDLQEILRVLGSLSDKFFGLQAKVTSIENSLTLGVDPDMPPEAPQSQSEGKITLKLAGDQLADFSSELGKSCLDNMTNAHQILSSAKDLLKDRSVDEDPQGPTKDDQAFRRKSVAIGSLERSMKIVDKVFGVIQKTVEDIECRMKIQDQINTERRERSGLLDPDTGLLMEPVDELIVCSKEPEETTQTTEDIESNLKNLEKRLGVNREQICQLTKKLNQLNRAVSQQLNDAKDRVNDLESRLVEMTCNIKSLVEKIEGDALRYGAVPSPEALDVAYGNGVSLLIGVQKALTELQADMEALSGKTDSLQQSNAKQGIEDLKKLVSDLDERKADRTEVMEKASKQDLELKLDTQQFEHTCDELNRSISNLLSRISYLDEECQSGFEKLTTDMAGFITAEEFERIRQCMAKQFKSLTKKLMKMQKQLEVAKLVGDDAAGVKRQIFKCLSCDRTMLMATNQEPKPFVARDGMLACRSTKPYTTYELEQIRQHCRGQQIPRGLSNYERAVVERQMSRLKLRDLRGNASSYWKSDHPACCKQYGRAAAVSPQNIPPAAAVSGEVEEPYPDPYQCIRPGGGVNTITNPYKRLMNVADLTSMMPDDQQQNVSQHSQQQGVFEDRTTSAEIETRVFTRSQDSVDVPASGAVDVSPLDITNAKSRSYTHSTDHQSPPKSTSPTSISQVSKQSSEDTSRRFSDPAVASSKKLDQKSSSKSGSAKSSSGRRTTVTGVSATPGPTPGLTGSSSSAHSAKNRRASSPGSMRSRDSISSTASKRAAQENYKEELEEQQLQQQQQDEQPE